MSFGFGLGAGLRALNAAQLALQTAGNNVANANTPGYSRQRVELVSALPYGVTRGFQIGTGVDVAGINRLVDEGLERRVRLQMGLVGAAEVDFARMRELEGLLAEPDNGLSGGLAGFFGSIGRLQTDPADRALRGGVVQSGSQLAQSIRMLSQRIGELGGSTFDEVRGLVRQVNETGERIAGLNAQIIALESNGNAANDLRDTREQLIKGLGQLMDVNAIERSTGSVDLLVGGHLLVAGDRASPLSVGKTAADLTQVRVGRSGSPLRVTEGRIAALLRQETSQLPGYGDRLDQMTRNLILEVNRRHTTGMPRSGPFQTLSSFYGAEDGDGDGDRGDELLAQSGLPFDVRSGELFVNVTNRETGAIERARIAVDPGSMTLRDLANRLSSIGHLTAAVDPTGRLRISADAGYGFDFSPRLDANPNSGQTFGGRLPSIGTTGFGPFDLSGQTFPVSFTVTTGTATTPQTTTVTLDATDFVDPSAASVDELVAAINDDLGGDVRAMSVGGRLVIQGTAGGSSSQLALGNVGPGTVLTSLGMTTTAVTGQDAGVAVRLEGTYAGSENQEFVFVAESDGQIGVTDNLRVRVYDGRGNLVTTLEVGDDYEPGSALDLGNGVKVSFGPGTISATGGDVFATQLVADSDTSDILVALGMNSFFHGSGAKDIEIASDLLANVDRLAAGIDVASGDAGNLTRLMNLRGTDLAALDTNTIEDFWADVVGDIGFETAGAQQTLQSRGQLLSFLEAERQSVSGVNIDEEMIDMVRYQQSYQAAARFISTVSQLTESLINLGR